VAPEIMWLSADYNLKGILREFENKEGFYPLTEENGIRIKYIDDFRTDDTDFYIKVIEKENTGE
jgi:translation initiation factor 2 alpha subunit (eIF-2alpha)